MPSLRELMPLLVGGAVGALSPQGADAVQSAAAWSNRLRQQDIDNERRDKVEANSARRLQLAEEAEKRMAKSDSLRTSVTERRDAAQSKKDDQYWKDRAQLDSARELYGKRFAEYGEDPEIANTMSTRELVDYEKFLEKEQSRFADIGSAQEHFSENPLGMGESASVYTDQGQFSTSGPRQPYTKTDDEFNGSLVDSKTRTLEVKANGKVADARDEIEEARRDMETYGPEEPEHKKALGTIRTQERKIQQIMQTLDEDVVQMMIKSDVPNSRIDEFRNRNNKTVDPSLSPPSHEVTGSVRDVFGEKLAALQAAGVGGDVRSNF